VQATPYERQQLGYAVDLFQERSGLLERSYHGLQLKVEALTRKLNSEQSARLKEQKTSEQLGKRLAHLLEALPGGVVVIDMSGAVLQNNSEAARLLGEPLRGCSWSAIVKRAATGRSTEDGIIVLKSGIEISLSRRPLSNESGEVILLTNVTDSRRMAELRSRKERLSAIGEMTAEFAHQVRTPLSAALLYAAQLDTATAEQQCAAEKITSRLTDLGRMVDDMLHFAAGTRTAHDIVNVKDVVASAVQSVDGQLKPDTAISFVVTDERLCVAGNEDALVGAIVNLITNADQAFTRHGRIVVSARRSNDTVSISVSDNGPGIPAEHRPRVFEPFFTTRPQGTGLGLAVVAQVAAAHGGAASVSSSKLGTTFTLELPLSEIDS